MEITSTMVQLQAEAGAMPAFVARPSADGKFPAIVVLPEAFGLNTHIKDVASRLARQGYATLAADLYYRETDRVAGYDNLPEAMRLMTTLWDDKVVKDITAAISYLQQQSFVRAERVGVTGFCMGGRLAFLTACQVPAVKAAVPFYGAGIGSVTQPSERTPRAPLEYAGQLAAPMLLFFGEQDSFIPLDEVNKIRRRLVELGKDADIVIYPGAPHGFFCNERDSYRADAAQDAWQRMLKFFERHLKG
ncbi:MAG: dienelactone hydrolase family protein [Candidatus Binatia bacterium]